MLAVHMFDNMATGEDYTNSYLTYHTHSLVYLDQGTRCGGALLSLTQFRWRRKTAPPRNRCPGLLCSDGCLLRSERWLTWRLPCCYWHWSRSSSSEPLAPQRHSMVMFRTDKSCNYGIFYTLLKRLKSSHRHIKIIKFKSWAQHFRRCSGRFEPSKKVAFSIYRYTVTL